MLQVDIDEACIVDGHRFRKIVDDTQHLPGVELRGMGGEHHAYTKMLQLFCKFLFLFLILNLQHEVFHTPWPGGIVHFIEGCIFQCIKQHYLAFYELCEPEKKIQFFFPALKVGMFCKKVFYDFLWTQTFLIAFFTIVQQQRKQDACLFNTVERQPGKQAVVKLKF